MTTPMLAFELLSTDDRVRALILVKELEKINNERKVLVARIVKEAHKKLDARELPAIVVLGDLSWRPAVLGLVATKLQETYNRSFFVWGWWRRTYQGIMSYARRAPCGLFIPSTPRRSGTS